MYLQICFFFLNLPLKLEHKKIYCVMMVVCRVGRLSLISLTTYKHLADGVQENVSAQLMSKIESKLEAQGWSFQGPAEHV